MWMGGKGHAPAALPPGVRPGAHDIRGWMGPRTGLDCCEKFLSHRNSNPDRPALSESLYRLSYPGPHIIKAINQKARHYYSRKLSFYISTTLRILSNVELSINKPLFKKLDPLFPLPKRRRSNWSTTCI
jgi:hypothetical protein